MIMRLLLLSAVLGASLAARADLVEDPSEDTSAHPTKAGAPPATGLIQDESKQPTLKHKAEPAAPTKVSPASENRSSSTNETRKPDKGDRNRNPDAPINFEGDTLSGDRSGGIVILEQNVKVTQDDLKITADKATLKFDRLTNEVIEVVAVGNVHFYRRDPETGQPVTADSREAIFKNAARTVVLKGEPKMMRGTDIVRGRQITYDLNTGWMKATGVEGVVQPTKNKTMQASEPAAGADEKVSEKTNTEKTSVDKSAAEKGFAK